jgi:hypothetical protein
MRGGQQPASHGSIYSMQLRYMCTAYGLLVETNLWSGGWSSYPRSEVLDRQAGFCLILPSLPAPTHDMESWTDTYVECKIAPALLT